MCFRWTTECPERTIMPPEAPRLLALLALDWGGGGQSAYGAPIQPGPPPIVAAELADKCPNSIEVDHCNTQDCPAVGVPPFPQRCPASPGFRSPRRTADDDVFAPPPACGDRSFKGKYFFLNLKFQLSLPLRIAFSQRRDGWLKDARGHFSPGVDLHFTP